jgi:hypothetical protein
VSADPDEAKLDVEPAGDSTYVPYGERSVLYDDGSAQLNSVDVSDAVTVEGCTIYNGPIHDPNTRELTEQEAAEFLNCDLEDLRWYVQQVVDDIKVEVESQVESHSEEKFYDSGDWYDVEWD